MTSKFGSDLFIDRHLGLGDNDERIMLNKLGFNNIDQFINQVIPEDIQLKDKSSEILPQGCSEIEALNELEEIANKNTKMRSLIGLGYYDNHMPKVIQRHVLENPRWYTSYTPYQAEIAQGRLEALFNFQTIVCELTGFPVANASLLDEGTAAAEAMAMSFSARNNKSSKVYLVESNVFDHTFNVLQTRAKPLGISLKRFTQSNLPNHDDVFGMLLQLPGKNGQLYDPTFLISQAHRSEIIVTACIDPLAQVLIKPISEFGVDVAVGSMQRFGVPMGFGGPHAAYFACSEKYKRLIPGRIVGQTLSKNGEKSLRLALQTREQHIRREKATSNICTAQSLLAIISSFYAIYHGPEGLKLIGERVNKLTTQLANNLLDKGYTLKHNNFFDTIVVNVEDANLIHKAAELNRINLRKISNKSVGISIDETTNHQDLELILELFNKIDDSQDIINDSIAESLKRKTLFLTHEVFNSHHSETQLLRYIRSLCDKDIALDRSMIPLGSCTMKLNSTSEMIPVGWNGFANIHPHAPTEQVQGYLKLIDDLEQWLSNITGYKAISLQPNAGSQGEYAGLLAIDSYHKANNDHSRNICLIPESAHGTNPASAQMVGYEVVVINCDENGDIDMSDLQTKAELHSNNIAAMMITYPSTHGVFEEHVKEVCEIIHNHGGFIYIDGANFNAMVGMCYPGKFGGDVSHLNLHKTFCIPHGGGGPGVGPIGVVEKLVPYLPKDPLANEDSGYAISGTNYDSASILPISWMYIAMMGLDSLRKATQVAILSTNYLAKRLSGHYKILYTGKNNLVAHECIIDVRPFKDLCGIEAEDIAKRLIDYGFHAPTMSWPVAGTLMIEPTESESLDELNRFCDAMIGIRNEI